MSKSRPLRIHLLGPFRVLIGDRAVDDDRWPRRKAKQLLQILALSSRFRLHREQLMEALWPDLSSQAAANNLNKTIHMARRALEPQLKSGADSAFVRRAEEQILLDGPAGVWVDAEAFERLGREAAGGSDGPALEKALELYLGDLLPENPYDDWCWSRRQQLRLLHRDLVSQLAAVYEREGKLREAAARLLDLLSLEPADEQSHRRLMSLYARMGKRRQALLQYQHCREALERELDAQPEEATERLHQDILAGRIAAAEEKGIPISARVESMAVLPFQNTSHNPELEYLCDGLTETLISKLSHLPRLRVMARSTVFRYKNSQLDPQELGRDLKVQAVVFGRVVHWSERVNIAAELVDVSDGAQLWGDQYNRAADDIFAVQEEISREIALKLKLKLTAPERKRLGKRHTRSANAYQSYLRGRFFWNKRTGKGLLQAIKFFREAIEKDSSYALAYSGLADAYNLLPLYGVTRPHEAMPKARAAAQAALEIDDQLAEAQTSLAYCKFYFDWDWEEAERGFLRALELNPNYATAHHWYHELLTALGRFEAEEREIQRALELDPLSLIIHADAGWGLYFARRYEAAVERLQKTLEMDPRFAVAHFLLGLVHQQLGDFEKAVAEIEEGISLLEGSPFALAIGVLGHACARSGRKDEARRQLQRLSELSEKTYVPAFSQALIHTALGEAEKALERLQRSCEERYDRLVYLKVEPMFDALRGEPRFGALLRMVGLVGHG